tara:strand:+ start:49 stop:468 length:420 start_codon:yes stop_codon:yes gene_type:complete
MKLYEILDEQTMQVVANDMKSTTLIDPKTKIQTVIPKDPNKPGMITRDPQTQKLQATTQAAGEVDQEIKPGETVEMQGLMKEKAVSRAQQQAAGIAHAARKGEIPASQLRGASKEMAKMKKSDLKDFASTPHKGLPKKK